MKPTPNNTMKLEILWLKFLLGTGLIFFICSKEIGTLSAYVSFIGRIYIKNFFSMVTKGKLLSLIRFTQNIDYFLVK